MSTAPVEVIGVTVTGVVVTALVVPLRTATSGRRLSVVAAVLFSAALKCAVPPLLIEVNRPGRPARVKSSPRE